MIFFRKCYYKKYMQFLQFQTNRQMSIISDEIKTGEKSKVAKSSKSDHIEFKPQF